MKHALTVLTNAAEVAETNAPKREAAAEAYARDGEHERAENLRAQAELDRAVAADCREVIGMIEARALRDALRATTARTTDGRVQAYHNLIDKGYDHETAVAAAKQIIHLG